MRRFLNRLHWSVYLTPECCLSLGPMGRRWHLYWLDEAGCLAVQVGPVVLEYLHG